MLFVFAHKCYFAQKLVPSHIQALRRSLETKRHSRIGRLGKPCRCGCTSIRVRLVWIIWRKSWRRRNLERYCLWLQVVKRTSDIWLRISASNVSVKTKTVCVARCKITISKKRKKVIFVIKKLSIILVNASYSQIGLVMRSFRTRMSLALRCSLCMSGFPKKGSYLKPKRFEI